VLAQLAIKLSTIPLPEATSALVDLMSGKAAKQPLVREGALSGLLGRELSFAMALAENKTIENAGNISVVLGDLAKLVGGTNKAQPFEEMLKLAAGQPFGGPVQLALLKGLSDVPKDNKGKKLIKL